MALQFCEYAVAEEVERLRRQGWGVTKIVTPLSDVRAFFEQERIANMPRSGSDTSQILRKQKCVFSGLGADF